MRLLLTFLAYLLWIIATLILVISIIGLYFCTEDKWADIGKSLINSLIDSKK